MNERLVLVLTGVAAAALAVASARALVCNVRRYREARREPPLALIDLSEAKVTKVAAPPNWPAVEAVEDAATAAGYASLADDRALTADAMGEAVIVVAGAVLGLLLTKFRIGARADFPGMLLCLTAFAGVGFGIGWRMRAVRVWEPLAARYRARYRVLTAVPAPAPATRRTSLLSRLLGGR